MIHVSLILVHYNTRTETLACLKSLIEVKTTGLKLAIIVVDNASQQQLTLPKQLEQREEIQVIRSESNLGFTGGNNMGIHYAVERFNSDFVVLLNNDTTVEPDFLKQLVKQAQENPKQGLICPKIYFSKGSEYHASLYNKSDLGNIIWYAGGSVDFEHLVAFHQGVDEVDRGQFDTKQTSEFATGCCVLIRREVLEKIGSFDKRFFLYLEDVDLSLRAKQAGYMIGFCPESVIYHQNAGSSGGSGSSTQEYYQTRNRFLIAFKNVTLPIVITSLRLAVQYMLHGNRYQKRGLLHAVTAQFGKQPII